MTRNDPEYGSELVSVVNRQTFSQFSAGSHLRMQAQIRVVKQALEETSERIRDNSEQMAAELYSSIYGLRFERRES